MKTTYKVVHEVDEPFYRIENGTRTYYYPDALGSIKVVKNTTDETRYIYDAWGRIALVP